MQKNNLILGAHMSIAGGLEQAVLRAESIGLTAVQFFSKSNRQWKTKPLKKEDIDLFRQTFASSTLQSATIHASYLINIGSPSQETAERSSIALAQEFERAQQLDVDHLVFHPGSHLKQGEEECLKSIAHQINIILNNAPQGRTKLVLETMAGQGSSVCYNFEQLAYIIDNVEHKERIGICMDTCHIFAAGYDIAQNYDLVIQSFNNTVGLAYLNVVHVNDSKKICGSRVDRHEHIGEGEIGLDAFKKLFLDQRLSAVSKILETPKDSIEDDIKNIATIRNLIKAK